jgi:hypothetical protein
LHGNCLLKLVTEIKTKRTRIRAGRRRRRRGEGGGEEVEAVLNILRNNCVK